VSKLHTSLEIALRYQQSQSTTSCPACRRCAA
jgi:hypothetical protein